MSRSSKFIAAIWMLIALAIARLTVQDIATVGSEEILRSPALFIAFLAAILLAGACFSFGKALWFSRHSARRLGVALSVLFSLGFTAYGLANAFIALKLQYAISLAAVLVAVLGLLFCLATFRLAKQVVRPSLSEEQSKHL
jgi:Kef-type K+ transport system membrane component KefB